MPTSDPAVLVTPAQRREGDPTPGMVREQAIAVTGMWSGLVRTEPRVTSGWHHHGDYETTIYVVAGTLRLECGPGGETTVEAEQGDFVRVPPGAVHREANPGDVESRLVVVRAGQGPPTVNVDGPARRDPV